MCCFQPVLGGNDGIFDKGEFGLDLVELVSDLLVVVVVVVVPLNLSNHVPVVKVGHSLVLLALRLPACPDLLHLM